MTAQLSDTFEYEGGVYALAAYSPEEPFHPSRLGMEPEMATTACRRGYVANYALDPDKCLILENLYINMFETIPKRKRDLKGAPINGVAPEGLAEGKGFFFNNRYTGIALPLAFTGGLLLGRGFLEDLYVHMGFHPAWKYREVHELLFEKGHLTEDRDQGARMAEIRRLAASGPLKPGDTEENPEVLAWILRTFDRRY